MNWGFFPFHLVTISPWPFFMGLGILSMVISFLSLFKWKMNMFFFLLFAIFMISLIMFFWWRDVVRESLYEGFHTFKVVKGLKLGMLWFIFSEVMFFSGFFWSFFHHSLNPDIQLGNMWPPMGVTPFNPFHIPLVNTAILVSSGLTATWAHHNLMKKEDVLMPMIFTIFLGVYFTGLQAFEYKTSSFSLADSVYGSSFFLATGFHGIHVLIGSTFLLVCLIRLFKKQLSPFHHLGFEASLWYWHFVDVVWLFLFMVIYWWGS